jgi:hypothetical protein
LYIFSVLIFNNAIFLIVIKYIHSFYFRDFENTTVVSTVLTSYHSRYYCNCNISVPSWNHWYIGILCRVISSTQLITRIERVFTGKTIKMNIDCIITVNKIISNALKTKHSTIRIVEFNQKLMTRIRKFIHFHVFTECIKKLSNELQM